MLKSFSTIASIATLLLIGGLFVLLRTTTPRMLTSQSTEVNPVAASDTPASSEVGFAPMDSPLPTPTVEPTPEPTPTAQPYRDLKVAAVERVATGPYLNVLWSPDGAKALLTKQYNTRHVLVKSEGNQTDIGMGDLWLLDAASGAEKLLLEKVGRYTWSPDSTKIALINPSGAEGIDGELLIYDLASGKTTTLAPVDFLGSDYEPQWLPSNEIVFVREGQLWTIGVDGSNEHSLPNFKFVSMTRDPSVTLHQKDIDALLGYNFSPDGKHIAYLTRHENMRVIARKLWIANADGSNAQLITGQAEGGYYKWSPDSNRLLFNTYRDIDDKILDERLQRWQGLWVVTRDGSNPYPIHRVDDWGMVISPVWSPDGSKVAFIDFQVDELDKATDIWIADATNKSQVGTVLRESQRVIRLIWWWPDGSSLLTAQTTGSSISQETFSTDRLQLAKP